MQKTLNALAITPTLPAVPVEPATATLPAVATAPATATLPAVVDRSRDRDTARGCSRSGNGDAARARNRASDRDAVFAGWRSRTHFGVAVDTNCFNPRRKHVSYHRSRRRAHGTAVVNVAPPYLPARRPSVVVAMRPARPIVEA